MFPKVLFSLAALTASIALVSPAFAREGDVEACQGKAQGDACSRADGDAGVCQPDASYPGVLTCDDDGASSSGDDSSSDGCGSSDDGSGSGGSSLAIVGLALAGVRKRR